MSRKRNSNRGKLSLYANLSNRFKDKKDRISREHAEYLASLPKDPLKRILYRMHPKRVFRYLFSKKGLIMMAKVIGTMILIGILIIGVLFAYFRRDLDAIRPGELNKRVYTTVTKYYDRNNELLWEDKGSGNYKLVVEGNDISDYMKKATVAIEDHDFYNHSGVSYAGLIRALTNNLRGGSTQGGSTLTQQLVKQVFFADEASNRGLSGIPRKIKEMILSIEVERMYSKDQILTLYLNESPYGGRRNGVESAARTYFDKSAKDLTLAESALLAGIPNQPGLYDPYNTAGNESLIKRQHKVLNDMVSMNYITKEEAEAAKKVDILSEIKPITNQYVDIKAPHFIMMVKKELEAELGKSTVGKGGLTVKTTLDYRIQKKAEEAMNDMFNSYVPKYAGFTNGAATVEDVKTGQIVALVGSRDWNYPGFGQDNAASAFIQPGSTIKPLVYAGLFNDHGSDKQNFGSGTVLADSPDGMKQIYGSDVKNADRGYKGNISIRQSLGLSRNIPAIKAMYLSDQQSGSGYTLKTIRDMGDVYYCTQGVDAQAGLSLSIGACGTRQVDHVNAFATLARGGKYMPSTTIMEVKNSNGDTLKKWNSQEKQIINEQSAYIVSDILSDDNARAGLYGRGRTGLNVTGVKTAAKTGTSDKGGMAKDIWMMSYSPVLAMGVWLGNPDTSILKNGNSSLPGPIINKVMSYAHTDIYRNEGKWKTGDWFTQPNGIQKIGNELFPSYYDKNKANRTEKMDFDRISKKKATSCTPDSTKISIDVIKNKDPISSKEVFRTTNPEYDATKDDDLHHCEDQKPSISNFQLPSSSEKTFGVSVQQGTHALESVSLSVNGKDLGTKTITNSGSVSFTWTESSVPNGAKVVAIVKDSAGYEGRAETQTAYTSN